MPVVLLDRLPLPKLKTYVFGSILALSACIYFAAQIIKDPQWNYNENEPVKLENVNMTNSSSDARSLGLWIYEIFFVMIREPICVWVSLIQFEFAICILISYLISRR